MYSGFFHCENIDILSTSPPPLKEAKQESTKRKMYFKGRDDSKLN